MTKLQGAYVGFLSEPHEYQIVQQKFKMDGYNNLNIIPLGHKKVLLQSVVRGEVEELVTSVRWWSTWFDRFEEWSPEAVSNQRYAWLRCFRVPLHAWGEALFKTIGFKFGTFVQVDSSTKNLIRGDLARIKITTENMQMIDSSLAITVMGKKFVIRILEEVGEGMEGLMGRRCVGECLRWRDKPSCRGSNDGGSEMAVVEGSFDGGSDEGWSEVGRNLSGAECQGVGKEHVGCRRMDPVQDREKTEIDPNLLGNISNFNSNKVNQGGVDRLGLHEKVRNDGDNTLKVQGKWDIVPVNPCTSRDYGDEARGLVGSRGEVERENCLAVRREEGVNCNNGPLSFKPMDNILINGVPFSLGPDAQLGGGPLDPIEIQTNVLLSKEVGTTVAVEEDTSNTSDRWRKSKANKKQPIYHQYGSKFLNFQNYI
jgi:hypothetical protein